MELQRIIDSILALTFMLIVTPIIGLFNAYIVGLVILLIWWFSSIIEQYNLDKASNEVVE